jgi:hypothetical protein
MFRGGDRRREKVKSRWPLYEQRGCYGVEAAKNELLTTREAK